MKQLFIGLDVHKKSWAATIQEQQLILKRFSMEADADLLIAYVSKHYPKHQVECCYEACCLGFGIYHDLTKAGWQVLVVNCIILRILTTHSDDVDHFIPMMLTTPFLVASSGSLLRSYPLLAVVKPCVIPTMLTIPLFGRSDIPTILTTPEIHFL